MGAWDPGALVQVPDAVCCGHGGYRAAFFPSHRLYCIVYCAVFPPGFQLYSSKELDSIQDASVESSEAGVSPHTSTEF